MFRDLARGKVIFNIHITGANQKSKKLLIRKSVNIRHFGRKIFNHQLRQMVCYHILYSFLDFDSDIEFLELEDPPYETQLCILFGH